MYLAKVGKRNKKAVDICGDFGYINITKKNEHELVSKEHELLKSEHELENSGRIICITRADMIRFI